MDDAPAMFAPGEKAVYAGQGLVEVQRVEMLMNTQMYVLRTREGTIHAPVGSPQLRRLSIRADVAAVFDLLGEQVEVPSRSSAWVRRYRALAEKLRTSDLFEAAEVFRDLSGRRLVKELSCGERGLRDRARSLLVDELTVVMGVDAEEVDRVLPASMRELTCARG